jgi:simple sugar transport system ATP-binding protein
MSDPLSAPTATEPCLVLRGIRKTYPGVVANDNVSLEAFPGEILALLGENGAGKSTLMKILGGLVGADEGFIEYRGREVEIRRPRDAQDLGIGMVHQHFMLVPDMTVAENICLAAPGRLAAKSDLAGVRKRLTELAQRHRLEVDPDAVVEDLSVGERQRVEILKLLYVDAELLIFDEPTAVLTTAEWQHLEKVLHDLAAAGKAVILITHKLNEVLDVADRCAVLRDGRIVGTVRTADTSKQELVKLMVGREIHFRPMRSRVTPGPVALAMENVSYIDDDGRRRLNDVSLEVRDGEILGIAGVEGNGQSQLVDIACGARSATTGTVHISGEAVLRADPRALAGMGTAVIPEDRHRDAVALPLTVAENLVVKELSNPTLFKSGILRRRAIREHAEALIERYDVRVPGPAVRLKQLSGGNQQKVVVARELSRRPRLVIAAQPTRGLDVGAMEFVYAALDEHRAAGGATLLVSSELEEILNLSDRIAVMVQGRVVGVVDGSTATAEQIGDLMTASRASE